MISNPKPGQRVQVWYATKPRRKGAIIPAEFMPLHGKCGTVRSVSQGKPRNHGVEIDGVSYVVPAGNLRPDPLAVELMTTTLFLKGMLL